MESCKKCGGKYFEYHIVGPHLGEYCQKCGAWQKWIRKSSATEQQKLCEMVKPQDCDYNINDDLPWKD